MSYLRKWSDDKVFGPAKNFQELESSVHTYKRQKLMRHYFSLKLIMLSVHFNLNKIQAPSPNQCLIIKNFTYVDDN